jgi:hypothetical protein
MKVLGQGLRITANHGVEVDSCPYHRFL